MTSPNALPDDALLHALSFLERRDLARFGRTSKALGRNWAVEHAWRERLATDFLWGLRGREQGLVTGDARARDVYAEAYV